MSSADLWTRRRGTTHRLGTDAARVGCLFKAPEVDDVIAVRMHPSVVARVHHLPEQSHRRALTVMGVSGGWDEQPVRGVDGDNPLDAGVFDDGEETRAVSELGVIFEADEEAAAADGFGIEWRSAGAADAYARPLVQSCGIHRG